MLTLAAFFSVGRFVHIAALMQLFGILLFGEYFAPATLRPRLRALFARAVGILVWWVFLTAILIFLAQSGQMGEGWGDVIRPAIWLAMLHTVFGSVWLWHGIIALAAVIIAAGPPQSAQWQRGMLLAAAGLLITYSLTGHAAMSDGLRGVLQRGNQILHLFSAAWWVGSLAPLLCCLPLLRQADRPEAISALIRFSRSAHVAVAVVILSGWLNVRLISGRWLPGFTNAYHWLLSVKVALVGVMVILAIVNRYRVVPAMARHHPRGVHYLAILTAAELILGAVVLLIVSVFATFEP
ncbi:copper homeostasis membrane protein CopD [Martelella alba]|uniref:Copper homeostasis membrane protein CopD n=1 Tax=Martelella alba TaxID=2590451 RepID=A0ABY2SQH8_9HYPH|nr:copper homeostasis membrane protein CopD [Martelella alba]TKI08226.1 copper homeostasis membrane protein CopD [Martelella alba]